MILPPRPGELRLLPLGIDTGCVSTDARLYRKAQAVGGPEGRRGWWGAARGLEAAIQIPPKGTKEEQQSRADNAKKQNAVHIEDEFTNTMDSRGSRVSVSSSYLKDTAPPHGTCGRCRPGGC